MASVRKLASLHQLSLHSEIPPANREQRRPLRKQFSEDIPDLTEKLLDSSIGIKVSLSNKNFRKTSDFQPPPLKIAWAENNDNAVIVTKCKEVTRPANVLTRHYSVEKESILHSKQEITNRIKQSFGNKLPEKTNINIYLGQNTKNSQEIDEGDVCLGEKEEIVNLNKVNNYHNSPRPKIISPLITCENKNARNLFQLRRNPRPKSIISEPAYVPTTTNTRVFDRTNTVVVIPVVEHAKSKSKQEPNEEHASSQTNTNLETGQEKYTSDMCGETTEVMEDISKPVNVMIRPSTAAAKRERFQKRTNSAFTSIANDTHFRPPLVRSSSAPNKPEHKSKFVATKRRIKSSTKKDKVKVPVTPDSAKSIDKENARLKQKVLNRCLSLNGGEVETMVSLVSPAESDNEEVIEVDKKPVQAGIIKSKQSSPNKTANNKVEENDVQRHSSLRKIVKSVSFQQSSIHAIRSFSASFPSRRTSMATGLLLGNVAGAKPTPSNNQVKKMNEKRNSISTEYERDPKRRSLRSTTEDGSPATSSLFNEHNGKEIPVTSDGITVNLKTKNSEESTPKPDKEGKTEIGDTIPPSEKQGKEQEIEEKEETFDNPKEKQCWDTYCKMTEKGINVSYDTILRGMLTPTEYRMRKQKEVHVIETVPENK